MFWRDPVSKHGSGSLQRAALHLPADILRGATAGQEVGVCNGEVNSVECLQVMDFVVLFFDPAEI